MTKIVIDLHEVEALKNRISQLEWDNRELERKLAVIDPENARARGADIAQEMFHTFAGKIFNEMGVSYNRISSGLTWSGIVEQYSLREAGDPLPYIKVNYGITFANDFKSAFIKLSKK